MTPITRNTVIELGDRGNGVQAYEDEAHLLPVPENSYQQKGKKKVWESHTQFFSTGPFIQKAKNRCHELSGRMPNPGGKEKLLLGLGALGAIGLGSGMAGTWVGGRKSGIEHGKQLQCSADLPILCRQANQLAKVESYYFASINNFTNPAPKIDYCIHEIINDCEPTHVNVSIQQPEASSISFVCEKSCDYTKILHKDIGLLLNSFDELIKNGKNIFQQQQCGQDLQELCESGLAAEAVEGSTPFSSVLDGLEIQSICNGSQINSLFPFPSTCIDTEVSFGNDSKTVCKPNCEQYDKVFQIVRSAAPSAEDGSGGIPA